MMAAFWNRFGLTPRRRAVVAVALLTVTALANARMLRSALRDRSSPWDAAPYAARFAPLQRDLPPGAEVNYVTGRDYTSGEDFADLLLCRLVLCPVRIVGERPRPLVIVNSTQPVPGFDVAAGPGVRLVRDYGNGLRLFQREPRP